jgi:hypothetical protein
MEVGNSIHSKPQHYMEVSGQPHASVTATSEKGPHWRGGWVDSVAGLEALEMVLPEVASQIGHSAGYLLYDSGLNQTGHAILSQNFIYSLWSSSGFGLQYLL